MSIHPRKLLVIGLDGATFDIIHPLMERGELPRISRLIRDGAQARLKSTIMPNSFPAWASLTTGVNPGKHGIFWSLIREHPGSTTLKLMSSYDIRAKRIWHYLGEAGIRVGVFNMPTEFPAAPVNGFLVCGGLTPDASSPFTYPEELKDEVLGIVPSYRCELDYAQLSRERLAGQLIDSIGNRERILLHLLKNKPWDFVMAVFTETDLVQHKYWAGIDSRHPEHLHFEERLKTLIYDVYRRLDEAVGTLVNALPGGGTVFLISDHGFGPFYQSFSLPLWLKEMGYLALADAGVKTAVRSILKKIGLIKRAQEMKSLFSRWRFRLQGKTGIRSLREDDVLTGRNMLARIDWDRTRAYSTPDYGVRLNLKGREAGGIVSPGIEESLLKEEIKRNLGRLTYSNGRPVFEAVLTKEEAYSGPWVDRAADIIMPIDYAAAPPVPEKWPYTLTHPSLNGTHSPFGILIAHGAGIRKGAEIPEAGVTDVTPTILSYFGVPPAEDMDGRIMEELFEGDILAEMERSRKGFSGFSSPLPPEGTGSSPGEDEKIRQKLEDLGYLD